MNLNRFICANRHPVANRSRRCRGHVTYEPTRFIKNYFKNMRLIKNSPASQRCYSTCRVTGWATNPRAPRGVRDGQARTHVNCVDADKQRRVCSATRPPPIASWRACLGTRCRNETRRPRGNQGSRVETPWNTSVGLCPVTKRYTSRSTGTSVPQLTSEPDQGNPRRALFRHRRRRDAGTSCAA